MLCCGDEPPNEALFPRVRGSDWVMHEAFCLCDEREKVDISSEVGL